MSDALLIVWCSTTGGTQQLAQAALRGAQQALAELADADDSSPAAAPGSACRLLHADEAGPEDVLGAASILFATPEHLASMAGPMKHFFDRCWYPVLDRINGRPHGIIVCAGSDGQGTIRQLQRFATGWRLKEVAEPLLVMTHAQTPEAILAPKTIPADELEKAATLGATLAAGIAAGMW